MRTSGGATPHSRSPACSHPPDAPLFYANAQPLRDTVTELVRAAGPAVHTVIPTLESAVSWADEPRFLRPPPGDNAPEAQVGG